MVAYKDIFHFKSHNNGYTQKTLLLFLNFLAKLFVNASFCHTSCLSWTLHAHMRSYLVNTGVHIVGRTPRPKYARASLHPVCSKILRLLILSELHIYPPIQVASPLLSTGPTTTPFLYSLLYGRSVPLGHIGTGVAILARGL